MGVTIKATGESKLFTALVLQSVFEFPPTFFSNKLHLPDGKVKDRIHYPFCKVY